MDAVTYPDGKVVEMLNTYIVPVKIAHDKPLKYVDPDLGWTPSLFITDPEGNILAGSIGFLPPEEITPWVMTGCGKYQFSQKQWNHSANLMSIVTNNYPESGYAPEALYFSAVAKFNQNHDAAALKEGYHELKKRYPENIWTKKALPYRLL